MPRRGPAASPGRPRSPKKCLDGYFNFLFINFCNIRGFCSDFHPHKHHLRSPNLPFSSQPHHNVPRIPTVISPLIPPAAVSTLDFSPKLGAESMYALVFITCSRGFIPDTRGIFQRVAATNLSVFLFSLFMPRKVKFLA